MRRFAVIFGFKLLMIILPRRYVALIPEEPEDMWHAYNLICEGDSVRASTVRYRVLNIID